MVIAAPQRWHLLGDEGFTDENPREFFFTLEGPAGEPLPAVEVLWPGVRVGRVLGAEGAVELGDGVTRFIEELCAGRGLPAGRP